MPRKNARTAPIYLPNLFSRKLADCTTLGKKGGVVVGGGGKIVYTDNSKAHARWNNVGMADQVKTRERIVRRCQAAAESAARELRTARNDLARRKTCLKEDKKLRDQSGRSVMRLDQLRAWIEEHMPSVLAVATEGSLLRVRFCATAMRGAGRRANSPNRFLAPAMWIEINVDTGAVTEARSDGSNVGAFHPHARIDNGNICIGIAVHQPEKQPASLDAIKLVLSEVEAWRRHYGDDCFAEPVNIAKEVWYAVRNKKIDLAPVQGTTGMVYRDVGTLLRAEPWDTSNPRYWCGHCDRPQDNCDCCDNCGNPDGACNCELCSICEGDPDDCGCCRYCEEPAPTWVHRGDANEHQLCSICGYCRPCGELGCDTDAEGGWGSVLWFLTTTDAKRIQTLATLEHDRGSERPRDYQTACDCGNCGAHTRYLSSRT